MSDADDIESIRERKREELREQIEAGTTDGEDASAAPGDPVHVDGGDHLNEIVASYDVVLVDFHADWCGPCQMLEPVVETLARETGAAVAKVDVDANQQLAAEYGVRGVPTLLVFADGDPVERLSGVQEEARLRELLGRHGA